MVEDTQTTAIVGRLDDFPPGSMRAVTAGDHRIVVVHTDSGLHALDSACPHQGYGLATGALDGELITCQWHNWKFDVRDGSCVRGEEAVACHRTEVVEGEVVVTVNEPTAEAIRTAAWPSLQRAIEADYPGQMARDALRLLHAGASPADVIWRGLELGAPRAEDGVGHEMALAADCLALAEIRHGDDRALPVVQALAGVAETTRDRPPRPLPAPDASIDLGQALEAEAVDDAMAAVLGSLAAGEDREVIRHRFIEAVSHHHLAYGHGIIYTQKAFEILDRVGWHRAPALLPHLAARIGWSTREDLLPYMARTMKALAAVDLEALAAAPDRQATGWTPDALVSELLDAKEAPVAAAARAVIDGAGVEGLLDAVTLAVSHRLLRHDLDLEIDNGDGFGWLDITHGLTTARASRWAWRVDPGPHTARQALFAVWLAFDTGRAERRRGIAERRQGIAEPRPPEPSDDDLGAALAAGSEDDAVARALGGERVAVGRALADAALADRAGSFIVVTHLVKTAQAAVEEAEVVDSSLPLAAAARYLAAPRRERFVALNVAESIQFLTTGRPPRR